MNEYSDFSEKFSYSFLGAYFVYFNSITTRVHIFSPTSPFTPTLYLHINTLTYIEKIFG
jgi:hypothetical protein